MTALLFALACAVPAEARYTAAAARGQAMAGAMVAVPGDVTVSLWNPALLAFNQPQLVSRTAQASGREVTAAIFGLQAAFGNNSVTYEEAQEFQDAGEPACISDETRERVWGRIQQGGGIKGHFAVGGFEGFSIKNLAVGARHEVSVRLSEISRDAAYLLLYSPSKELAQNAGNQNTATATPTCPNGRVLTPVATCPTYVKPNTIYGVQIRSEIKIGNDYPVTYATILPLAFLRDVRVAVGGSLRLLDGGRYEGVDGFLNFKTGASVCEDVPEVDRNYVQFIHGIDGLGLALDGGVAVQVGRDWMFGWSLVNAYHRQRWKAVREVFTWDLNPKSSRYLDFYGYSEAMSFIDHDPVILRMGASWLPQRYGLAVSGQIEGTPAEQAWRVDVGAEKSWRFGSVRGGIVSDLAYRILMFNVGGGVKLGPWHWDLHAGMTAVPYAKAMGFTAGTSMALWF